jgi:hypothetical protein
MNRVATGVKNCPYSTPFQPCDMECCFTCFPRYTPYLRCMECKGPSNGGRMVINNSQTFIKAREFPCCQNCFDMLRKQHSFLGYFLTREREERCRL